MQTIIITGLVIVEKIALTLDLARHYSAAGQRVTVVDNVARLPIDTLDVPAAIDYQRLARDILPELDTIITQADAGVLLVALSEQVPPDALFGTLASFDDMTVLALIDLRTCDCFPAMRERLEQYADLTIYCPYELEDVINKL
jgi:hypothetical protein